MRVISIKNLTEVRVPDHEDCGIAHQTPASVSEEIEQAVVIPEAVPENREYNYLCLHETRCERFFL
jgi:hypothetical protein